MLVGALSVRAQIQPPPIRVTSCHVNVAGHGDSTTVASQMLVRFVNTSSQTLRSVTWRASTQAGTIDFRDTGTFSPGVNIYRRPVYMGTNFHRPPLRDRRLSLEATGPGTCEPIKTVAADGAVWHAAVSAPQILVPNVPSDGAASVPATFDNASHDPIGIVSCQFAIVRGRAFGHVHFRNLSKNIITSVRFRAFYGPAGLNFDKDGTFSPGVLIDSGTMSRRDLPQNAFDEYVTLEAPQSCTTVSATYQDGTVWQNPAVSPTEPSFPQPPSEQQ
jgi:hypothetical protein